MTDSSLRVVGADKNQLSSFLNVLLHGGAVIEYDSLSVMLSGNITEEVNIETAPYPAFPTDLQPLMAPLLAVSLGGTIREGVWRNRFGYLDELSKFGVLFECENGFTKIKKSVIRPAKATAPDLRGGAALILAALYAGGESVIENTGLIKRGYGDIVNKLRTIGADIEEF